MFDTLCQWIVIYWTTYKRPRDLDDPLDSIAVQAWIEKNIKFSNPQGTLKVYNCIRLAVS